MKLRTALILATALVALPLLAVDKTPVKPGKWQITTQMHMSGMPDMPARTSTNCVTPEDAAKAENTLPKMEKNSPCMMQDVKVDGRTITWKVSCDMPNGGKVTGDGKVTYDSEGTEYKGEMHMTMPQGEMNSTFHGKRIGPCD